jgi:hypothetical protein
MVKNIKESIGTVNITNNILGIYGLKKGRIWIEPWEKIRSQI